MNLYSYNMPRILRGIELKLMLVLFPYDDQTFHVLVMYILMHVLYRNAVNEMEWR